MKKYIVTVYDNRTEWRNEEGKLHRENGPAAEYKNGGKEWYLNGKLHRENGPAIERANGTKFWYINDKLHRENGPAVEDANGDKFWYLNGKLHREDGPAVEDANGEKQYWVDGCRVYEEVWKQLTSKKEPSCDGKIVEIDGKKYKLKEIKERKLKMENNNEDNTFSFNGDFYGGSGISNGWHSFTSSFSNDPILKQKFKDVVPQYAEERIFSVVYLDPIGEKRFENGLTLNQAKNRLEEIQSDFKDIVIFLPYS